MHRIIKTVNKYKYLYLLLMPGMILFFIYSYIPMGWLVMAFQDFRIVDGIFGSRFVGFDNFIRFFQANNFWTLMRNTVVISFSKLLFGFPVPIIFAILLSEVEGKGYRKIIQSVCSFPHFLSWVIISGLMVNLFSPSVGIINIFLKAVGLPVIDILTKTTAFVPLLVTSSIWRNFGWNSIIYLAAISGLDPQLYEAASIDGAGHFRKVWSITLPGIMPVIMILLFLDLGRIMNADFTQIVSMVGNYTLLYSTGDVIDTFVYRAGILQFNYSFATAANLFKGVLGVSLVLLADRLAKMAGQEGIW